MNKVELIKDGKKYTLPYRDKYDGWYSAPSINYLKYLKDRMGFKLDVDSYSPYRKIFVFENHLLLITYNVTLTKNKNKSLVIDKNGGGYIILHKDIDQNVIKSFKIIDRGFLYRIETALDSEFNIKIDHGI